jgi:hypothetical protein
MTATINKNPILSNDDLFRLWQHLMGEGGFGRRSLWLIFLEKDGRPHEVIMPIDDIPLSPQPAMVANLVHIVDQLCERDGVVSAPMLLSRPGSSAMTESDRSWAKCLRSALGERYQWPIHLATEDHLQVFAPDDLV